MQISLRVPNENITGLTGRTLWWPSLSRSCGTAPTSRDSPARPWGRQQPRSRVARPCAGGGVTDAGVGTCRPPREGCDPTSPSGVVWAPWTRTERGVAPGRWPVETRGSSACCSPSGGARGTGCRPACPTPHARSVRRSSVQLRPARCRKTTAAMLYPCGVWFSWLTPELSTPGRRNANNVPPRVCQTLLFRHRLDQTQPWCVNEPRIAIGRARSALANHRAPLAPRWLAGVNYSAGCGWLLSL